MIAFIAAVFASLAAVLHVYIFVMESVQWTQPRIWKRFGVPDQSAADTLRPMAYNQGFYNLFLAVGVVLGVVLYGVGAPESTARAAGLALALFALGSMVAAALVLVSGGKKYVRPALVQGTLPLIGFVLFVVAG